MMGNESNETKGKDRVIHKAVLDCLQPTFANGTVDLFNTIIEQLRWSKNKQRRVVEVCGRASLFSVQFTPSQQPKSRNSDEAVCPRAFCST